MDGYGVNSYTTPQLNIWTYSSAQCANGQSKKMLARSIQEFLFRYLDCRDFAIRMQFAPEQIPIHQAFSFEFNQSPCFEGKCVLE